MAAQIVIDGDGRECAVLIDWPTWRMLATIARGALPTLFDDVIDGGDEGGDEASAGGGVGSAGGGGDARSAGHRSDGWRAIQGGRVVDPVGARRVQ